MYQEDVGDVCASGGKVVRYKKARRAEPLEKLGDSPLVVAAELQRLNALSGSNNRIPAYNASPNSSDREDPIPVMGLV